MNFKKNPIKFFDFSCFFSFWKFQKKYFRKNSTFFENFQLIFWFFSKKLIFQKKINFFEKNRKIENFGNFRNFQIFFNFFLKMNFRLEKMKIFRWDFFKVHLEISENRLETFLEGSRAVKPRYSSWNNLKIIRNHQIWESPVS